MQVSRRNSSVSCIKCKRYDCAKGKNINYCFECDTFPCKLIKLLDKSYQQCYSINLVENTLFLCENSIDSFFMKKEKKMAVYKL
ncbi:MAG: DUF3795 domain-containing protein [Cytophagaceae bacterium]|nr:DUF3795 domain-containing protein [Cytophagaceae bacterium]